MGSARSATGKGFAAGLLLGAAGGLLLALAFRVPRPDVMPDAGRADGPGASSAPVRPESEEPRPGGAGAPGARSGPPASPAPSAARRDAPAAPLVATGAGVLEALRRAEETGGSGAFQMVFALALAVGRQARPDVRRGTVRPLLAHDRPEVRRAGLLLARLVPDPPVATLVDLAREDADPTVRALALGVLADLARPGGALPVEAAVAELLHAIREEPDASVREAAARRLPGLTAAAADVAVRLIREEVLEGFVAREMIRGLVAAGRAAPLLEGDPPRELVEEIAAGFGAVFAEAGPDMLPVARTLALRYEDLARGAGEESLPRFAQALQRLGETAALERMARNDRLSVRVRGECLERLLGPGSRPLALETARCLLADDPVAGMRLVAVRTLEFVDDETLRSEGDPTRRALEAAAREDPSPWVREAAARRLAELDD